jgi:hypothetical protein
MSLVFKQAYQINSEQKKQQETYIVRRMGTTNEFLLNLEQKDIY